MSYCIDSDKCMGCHTCMGVCPIGAILITDDGKCKIDFTKCAHCGTCAGVCPANAITAK